MPYRRFAKLQDEYLAVSKQMKDAETPQEKLRLLEKLQTILNQFASGTGRDARAAIAEKVVSVTSALRRIWRIVLVK